MDGIGTARTSSMHPTLERALTNASSGSVATPGQRFAAAVAAVPQPGPLATPVPPRPRQELGTDTTLRALVERASFGFSVGDYQEALARGYDGWIEWQLDWQKVDDDLAVQRLHVYQALRLSNTELLEQFSDPLPLSTQLSAARMIRAMYSRRLLYVRMVEFWTDHFNVYLFDELCQWFKITDDRDVIRRHALGKFPDMLRASAHSPAMMWYLDNYTNVAGAVQENYARELQELHTLGADGPYDEHDVTEVARCFSGWGVHGAQSSAGRPGNFHFDPALHDNGPKVVLGVAIPAGGGKSDGDFVLDLLAMHPSTARHISRKMARWLLSYDPPAHVVDDLTQIYLSSGGDVKDMLRYLLRPETLFGVPEARRRKLKRPLHLVVSLTRAILLPSSVPEMLAVELDNLGQQPFLRTTPDGYPDHIRDWGTSMLARWTYAVRLMSFDVPFNRPSLPNIHALLATAPPGSSLAEAIDWMLTGGRLGEEVRGKLQRYLDTHPMTDVVLREAIALAASSTGYQFY